MTFELISGHIASSLQTTEPDVYLSTDGGYDWKKVSTPSAFGLLILPVTGESLLEAAVQVKKYKYK